MTKTFANSQAEAHRKIEAAADRAIKGEMILQTERAICIKMALADLRMIGSAYICGEKIVLTNRAQDGIKSVAIRSMSAANFERFAYGM
jgi:hypothetical protein